MKNSEEVLSLILPEINRRTDERQAHYRHYLDSIRDRIVVKAIPPGTVVMIKDPKYAVNGGPKPYGAPTYLGPYVVVKQTKFGNYFLKNEQGDLLDRSLPIDQLQVSSLKAARQTSSTSLSAAPVTESAAAASSSASSNSSSSSNSSNSSMQADSAADDDEIDVETNASAEVATPVADTVVQSAAQMTKISEHDASTGRVRYKVHFAGSGSKTAWLSDDNFVDTAIIGRYWRELHARTSAKRFTRSDIKTLLEFVINLSDTELL